MFTEPSGQDLSQAASTPQIDNQHQARHLRKVATSVVLGTTIEWYDFMLYGAAAATVFGPLFFPGADPVASILLSFSTFAVGFAARPLGGIIFGHFGDILGRKKMLVLSLTLMGVATVAMGLIPDYSVIGAWAPILLVTLRLIQGFGVGGEWGGAVLTAIEHAPPNKRGLFGSLPQIGVPAGLVLSTLAFLAVSQLPEEEFLSWGWRIPFVASAILVAVGMYIRVSLEETPDFKSVQKSGHASKIPALDAIRRYPAQILLAIVAVMGSGIYFYSITTYSISYATTAGVLSRSETLLALLISSAVMIFALPLFGQLSQKQGARPFVVWGLLLLGIWIFPVFGAINTGNLGLTILAFVGHAILFAVSYGALSTFVAEIFPAQIRYSGSSIAFQAGVLLGGAIAPLLATSLVKLTGTVLSVCIYAAVFAVIGAIAAAAISRRKNADTT